MGKIFTKNDVGFKCAVCGHEVPPLKYSSRDHCNKCLCSLHVDITPGDRQNDCKGIFNTIEIIYKSNNYDIVYKCNKCGQIHTNKMAKDDNFEKILEIMRDNSIRGN